jgi:phosphatidylglycerol:prolipoprotein diacylglycerol transferase
MHGFTLSGNPQAEPRVLDVRPGSPADRAGLKRGDRLQSINDNQILSTGQAYWALLRAFSQRQPLYIRVENRPAVTVPAITPPARSLPVHPTQIYSVIDGLVLCLLLLAYAPFRRHDGELFALMMSIYPVTRFCVESLRSDEAAVFGTRLSISQNVSLLLLICAAALWFCILRQPRGTAFGRGIRDER